MCVKPWPSKLFESVVRCIQESSCVRRMFTSLCKALHIAGTVSMPLLRKSAIKESLRRLCPLLCNAADLQWAYFSTKFAGCGVKGHRDGD